MQVTDKMVEAREVLERALDRADEDIGSGLYAHLTAEIAAALAHREAEAVGGTLTLSALQAAHIERQEEWCPDQKPDLSFRGNEMAGEVGEACNVIKKLERERQGWRGSRATKDQLAEELADVIHTAILCAITAGIDIEPATVAKFDATSEKNGLATHIRSALVAPPAQEPVEGRETCKLYHSRWPTEDLLKAREPGGLITDDGEAWKYQYTHSDAQGGLYDLVYRPVAAPPAVPSGMVLVPVEPTRSHLERLAKMWGYTLEETADSYAAFIEAIPAPEAIRSLLKEPEGKEACDAE